MNINSQEAAEIIRNGGRPGAMRVNGKLELTGYRGETLPDGLHCYELDASDSELIIPDRFTTGSITLRNCTCLETLPEGLNVWFLDLTGCTVFNRWPKSARLIGEL